MPDNCQGRTALNMVMFCSFSDPHLELSKNIFKGVIAISVVFLFVCMLVGPNGE